MNKKNIILILVGILIISMRFNVTFGHINIDVTNDCVGFLLIIIGVLPMINRNSRFKKSGIVAIVGFIASVIAQVINFIDWQEAAGSMLTISLGITVYLQSILLIILQKHLLWNLIFRRNLL